MIDHNQLIHDLRKQVTDLATRVSVLERSVQEESQSKYAAYKRIDELNSEIQNLKSSQSNSE